MSAHAFIVFLRTEADQAEERARQLRATAAAIEANSVPASSAGVCAGVRWSISASTMPSPPQRYPCCHWFSLTRSNSLCTRQLAQRNARETPTSPNVSKRHTRSLFPRIMITLNEHTIPTCRARTLFPWLHDNGQQPVKKKNWCVLQRKRNLLGLVSFTFVRLTQSFD